MSWTVDEARRDAEVRALLGIEDVSANQESTSSPAAAERDRTVGARIAEARRRARLSGAELGARVRLGRDQISKIETGRRRLGAAEAPEIALALGVTIGWLLGEDDSPRLALAHRLSCGPVGEPVAAEDLPATQRRALQVLEVGRLLSGRVEMPASRLSPMGAQVFRYTRSALSGRPRNKAEAQRQGRRLAEKVRAELDLGSAAIRDLAALIETHFGVDVDLSPLGRDADGLCAHTGEQALIVASTDFPDGHVRFTMAHELGHHLLADPREVIAENGEQMYSDNIVERRVNAFAAHLLLPDAGVQSVLASLDIPADELPTGNDRVQRALGNLMYRFGVSLPALLFQLADLRVLSFDEVAVLRQTLRAGQVTARHRLAASVPQLAAPLAESVCEVVRPPQRLLETALTAARARKIGTSLLATLLDREDDAGLFEEVMGDEDDAGRPIR